MPVITLNRQRICPGVYYSIRTTDKVLTYDVTLSVKWYGFACLGWLKKIMFSSGISTRK